MWFIYNVCSDSCMTAGVFSKERTVIFYKLRLVFVKKQDLSSVLCQVKCWHKVTTCTWSNHRMIGVIDGKINIINKSVLSHDSVHVHCVS